MDINLIREAMHAQPFRPFRVCLVDGREALIPHPDFIAASPRRVHIINSQDESSMIVEPLLIVSLDFAVPASEAGPQSNGSGGA